MKWALLYSCNSKFVVWPCDWLAMRRNEKKKIVASATRAAHTASGEVLFTCRLESTDSLFALFPGDTIKIMQSALNYSKICVKWHWRFHHSQLFFYFTVFSLKLISFLSNSVHPICLLMLQLCADSRVPLAFQSWSTLGDSSNYFHKYCSYTAIPSDHRFDHNCKNLHSKTKFVNWRLEITN